MPAAIILDRVVAVVKAPWFRWVLVGLLIAMLWARGSHYERERDSWKAAWKAERAALVATADAAKAKAEAARIQTENQYAKLARTADANPRVADQRAAARRYADAHRLRPQAPRPARGGTAAAGQGGPAEGGDRPGQSAEFLVVTRNDFELLVANSIRLQQVHDWGQSLIDAKLARPELPTPDFEVKP